MRVLCGGPTRETESDLYRLHVDGLRAQAFTVGNVWRATASVSERIALGDPPNEPDPPTPYSVDIVVRHEVVPDASGGPRWHHDKIERVAKARQAMMDTIGYDACVRALLANFPATPNWKALPKHWSRMDAPDALLMVDTDVILGPGVLERLWAVDADVVYGVFWTADNWGQPETSPVAPQVWHTHPYDWKDIRALTVWNALCEPGVNEVEVQGGGACTLIRGRGFESHYWPLLESLKGAGRLWPGEDRTYCLGLECRGIRQVAVTGLPIVHLYDKALQTPENLAKARQMVGL